MFVKTYSLGIALLLLALVWVQNQSPPWLPADEFKQELVKMALQVLVVGLVGGAAKWLLDHLNARRTFHAEMLERIGQAHKEVYRVRRLLPGASPDAAQALLGELMNTRQDLGATSHAARVGGLVPSERLVRRETDTMRAYLESVIVGGLAPVEAPERAAYREFLDWRTAGTYEETFKKSYLAAKRILDRTLPE